jgi:hypothetical protein
MNRSRNLLLARVGRVLAVLGLGVALAVAALSAPAQAATSITLTQSITVPGLVRHQIDVHVPMNQ